MATETDNITRGGGGDSRERRQREECDMATEGRDCRGKAPFGNEQKWDFSWLLLHSIAVKEHIV